MDWVEELARLNTILAKRKAEKVLADKAYAVANEIMAIDGDLQDMEVVCESIK